MEISFFISLAVINILAAASPGPDFLMVVKNTLSYGKKAGFATSLGLMIAILFHIFYSAIGIGYIISQSIIAFNILKVAGALYLLFLAYKMFKAKPTNIKIERNESPKAKRNEEDKSLWAFFRQGILVNIFNPKATLYFVSLFSVFIPAEATFLDIMKAIGVIEITTILWFFLVVTFFSLKKVREKFSKLEIILNRAFGAFLTFFGTKIIMTINNNK